MNPSPAHSFQDIALPKRSRRQFLLGAAATLGVPLCLSRRSQAVASLVGPTSQRLNDFLPQVGTLFREIGTGRALVLANAERFYPRFQVGDFEQISLRFTPPAGEVIESRIHKLEHVTLGRLELFLTPVGSSIRYGGTQNGEAVISYVRMPT